MAQKQRVFLIDDHALFRDGLRAIIEKDEGFEVVGEAGTGHEAIPGVRRLKPDLVVVDISLPDRSGIQLTREIRGLLPESRVMVVSMHSKIEYIVKAFQSGATGYVIKESASGTLIQGLKAISKGEYFMDSSVSHKTIEKLMEFPAKEEKIADAAYETLTSREQEVMLVLAEGLSIKEISERLFISPKTVENHRTSIMKKLGIQSPVELVRYAARIGLIDLGL